MIKDFILSGLINKSKEGPKNASLQGEINEKETPKTYLFVTNPTRFYIDYCQNIEIRKLREKRFIDFETPNRALITHEYDMELLKDFDYDSYYYFFNPMNRLSWLKISQEDKRISVADSQVVKDIIKDVLKDELNKIQEINFENLWKDKIGFPCFIKLEKMCSTNFLLSALYYDSIVEDKSQFSWYSCIIKFLSPLIERKIQYEYEPLRIENRSSWLYIKSPSSFNLKIKEEDIDCCSDDYDIDGSNIIKDRVDPEKISLTIIRKKELSGANVNINFKIVVPCSLKVWYLSIYYLSFIACFVLILNFVNSIYLKYCQPIFNSNIIADIVQNKNFSAYLVTIIAAIITTRGWLISEETILKRYSITITIFMVSLMALHILISFMP